LGVGNLQPGAVHHARVGRGRLRGGAEHREGRPFDLQRDREHSEAADRSDGNVDDKLRGLRDHVPAVRLWDQRFSLGQTGDEPHSTLGLRVITKKKKVKEELPHSVGCRVGSGLGLGLVSVVGFRFSVRFWAKDELPDSVGPVEAVGDNCVEVPGLGFRV